MASFMIEISCCKDCPKSKWVNTRHPFTDPNYELYCQSGTDSMGHNLVTLESIPAWCPMLNKCKE